MTLTASPRNGRLGLCNDGHWLCVFWTDGTASIHAKLDKSCTFDEWRSTVEGLNDVDRASDVLANRYGGISGFWPMRYPEHIEEIA